MNYDICLLSIYWVTTLLSMSGAVYLFSDIGIGKHMFDMIQTSTFTYQSGFAAVLLFASLLWLTRDLFSGIWHTLAWSCVSALLVISLVVASVEYPFTLLVVALSVTCTLPMLINNYYPSPVFRRVP